MKLTDYEINILIYKDALAIDKRPYIIYYLSLIRNSSNLDRISDGGGSFNISYQIPQIVYFSLISSIINAILKSICLTEKNIS